MRVVDSSFLLDLVVFPDRVPQRLPDGLWHAPQVLDVEFTSGVRGLLLGGKIDVAAAECALTDYTDLAIETWPATATLRRRVLELRHNLTAYDASYVALAEALEAPLLTRDAKIARGAPPGVTVHVV